MQTVPATRRRGTRPGTTRSRRSCAASCRGRRRMSEILIETRQYAKRQRTWFRHQLPADRVTRLDPRSPRLGARVARLGRSRVRARGDRVKIGITCYPTYGGSGAVATELGIALARRGHEIHFITYKQPFRLPSFLPRIYFHEVDVGRYPLFEYPPYDLALAVRMHEVVLAPRARSPALPLRDSARDERVDRQGDAAADERRHARRDDAARHRHHDRRPGSVVPPDHEILDREVGWPHGGVAVSAARDADDVRLHGVPHRGHSELHRSRRLRPREVHVAPRRAGRREQARADARLELPAGEAREGRRADLRARRGAGCRPCSSWSATAPIASTPRRRRASLACRTACSSSGRSTRSRRCSPAPICFCCRRAASRSA